MIIGLGPISVITVLSLYKKQVMHNNSLPKILLAFFLLNSIIGSAQPKEIFLWPNGAAGSQVKREKEKVRITDDGEHVISNVHNPSITPYIPSKEKATGVAVVIAPGGGHRELWIDHEGYNEAKWLSERGIAAFVLKYRLAKDSNSTYTVDKDELADIQRAIRMVRSHSKEWNIDTTRIGVMGFSAGGELAALAAMRFENGNINSPEPIERQNSRPSFQALIYPANSEKFEVVKNAPPVFIAGGYNDREDIAKGIAELYIKYKNAGVPAELHIYSNAGHGFGMREKNKGAEAGWIERFNEWLLEIGMLRN
ncbi:MAG: alpha/beta hydrolase [Flavisolibacter sp.]